MRRTDGQQKRGWTDEELGFICSPPRGWTSEDIGRFLDRTPKTVRNQRSRIRAGWARQHDAVYTEEFFQALRESIHEPSEWVARRLGVLRNQVKRGRRLLQLREGLEHSQAGVMPLSPNHVGQRTLLAKTCHSCGLLWGGAEFTNAGRGWHPDCKRCRSRQRAGREESKPRGAYTQACEAVVRALSTPSMPYRSRNGQPWTGADLEVLKDGSISIPERAAKLGRTYQAVRAALARYGIPSHEPAIPRMPTGRWELAFTKARGELEGVVN